MKLIKIKFEDKKLKKKTLNNIRNSIKTRNIKKLNITKMDNAVVNRKFNGTMYFTK